MTCNFNLDNIGSNTSNPSCATLSSGIQIAVVFNKDCNITVTTIEHASEDSQSSRNIQNACGYIAYKTKNSKGVFGTDYFSIPLGKHRVRMN